MLYGYATVQLVVDKHQLYDGTVARGVSTSSCPVIWPIVPSLFRPTELD